MHVRLVLLAVVGSVLLAACGSSLDDAAVPASTAAPAASVSPSVTTGSAQPLDSASASPSTSATPSASSGSPSASTTEVSTVLRTSTVQLTLGDGWTGTFTWDGGYAVSDGQPWEGVTTTGSGSTISIQVKAGEHLTSDVAQWFRQRVSAMVPGNAAFDAVPSELSFAISGTLNVNGSTFAAVIGQGSLLGKANWWIGGSGWIPGGHDLCSGVFSTTMLDPPPNGPATIFILGQEYPFEVSSAPC
jgi:hypothetical protein